MTRRDYAPAGKQLRRALWRKAAALSRQQACRVLCDPRLPPDADAALLASVLKRVQNAVIGSHVRAAQDCQ